MTDVDSGKSLLELLEDQRELKKTAQLYEVSITQTVKKVECVKRGKLKFSQVSDTILIALIQGDLKRLRESLSSIQDDLKNIEDTISQRRQIENDQDKQNSNDNGASHVDDKSDEKEADHEGEHPSKPDSDEEQDSGKQNSTSETPNLDDSDGLGRDVDPAEFIDEDQIIL